VPDFLALDWQPPAGVRAAFTLRTGGASEGAFATNNTAKHVGDDEASVLVNRAAIRAALALPSEPVWLNQVHGIAVCDLDGGAPAARVRHSSRRLLARVVRE
jgi:polyphenol oxidase